MGKRGPKPTPTQILKMRDSLRVYSRQNEVEPLELKQPPEPPHWLESYGKRYWRKMAKRLWRTGLLTDIDLMNLAMACDAYQTFRELKKLCGEGRKLATSKQGNVIWNPAYNMMLSAKNDMRRWMLDFGMGPANRVGLEGKKPTKAGGEARADISKYFQGA